MGFNFERRLPFRGLFDFDFGFSPSMLSIESAKSGFISNPDLGPSLSISVTVN